MRYGIENLDYFHLCSETKKITESGASKKIRIALLADFSSQQLSVMLKALFFKNGAYADILEAAFDSIDHAIYSDDSPLKNFSPVIVLILECCQSLRARYYGAKAGGAAVFLNEKADRAQERWDKIKEKYPGSVILQSNWVLPFERPFGSFSRKVPGTFLSIVESLNRMVTEASKSRGDVFMIDLESIASYAGKKTWFDERLWALYKYPCALEYFPHVAQAIIDITLALKGSVIKCVVVDLDNTLWGGVIGDDGLEGIHLGHGDEGEAFVLFQHYLLELKKRGILLAVCSKNDPENARLPFRRHPEMVLREDDFAVFVANWEDKPANILLIQETLNIGFDSILFLDDSAFERNFVRKRFPEVLVPELPEDPADYVKVLSELNLFETTSYSPIDSVRTQQYQEEFRRKVIKSKFENHDDYLRSLDMEIILERFSPENLGRISQLIQRSNQFNLATRRYTEAQCESFMRDEAGFFPLCVTLKDRFGDYGLILCAVVSWEKTVAVIEEWVMSCRVLFRGVEQCAMNQIVEMVRQKGIGRIVGRFVPSDKNKIVKDFYRNFGFKLSAEESGGASSWELEVNGYSPTQILMEIKSNCLTPNI
jgi:FkbH-like protein